MKNKWNLRLVELDCPYDTWESTVTQGLFAGMVRVKLRGYLREYPYGTLPVDTSDFIATHYLICRETPQGPKVIASYRWCSLERSRVHGQAFGGLALARAAGDERHTRAVTEIVERCSRQDIALEYIGSWTIEPSVREDRDLVAQVRSIFDAIYVFRTLQTGCEIVFGGTLRFKMERYMAKFGAEPLRLGEEALPPVKVPFLLGEPVLMMHMKQLEEAVRFEAVRWRELWNSRLIISSGKTEGDTMRDAA